MPEQTRVLRMKQFFSTPDRPVTNQELMDFRKSDRKGFDELASLVEATTVSKTEVA